MKQAINNKKRPGYRGFAAAAVCLMMLAAGCQKPYELNLPLAVTSNTLNLAKEAGSTHILVYSTGKWTAAFTEEVKWGSISKTSGEGNNDLIFSYSTNYGVSRKVGLVFTSGGLRDTVMLVQAGEIADAALSFAERTATIVSAASTMTVGVTTNALYSMDDIKVQVFYDDGEGNKVLSEEWAGEKWLSDVTFDPNALTLTFSAPSYTGDTDRVAYITLSLPYADGTETQTTLTVTQNNELPRLTIPIDEYTYEGVEQTYTVPVETNLASYGNQMDYRVEYDDPTAEEDEWIKNVILTGEGLKFKLLTNEIVALRSATIHISFTDSKGNNVSATYRVHEKLSPKVYTYAELRAKITTATGEFTIDTDHAIDGFIISDPESANICLSPQTGQFAFDFTENYKTAYIENENASYGFCLKFNTVEDNTLQRHSKVKIYLKGATLVKESDPTRFTIRGLTADNIIAASEPDATLVPFKSRTIAKLTDSDIFTWVSLQNVEIGFKDGAYTNIADGYTILHASINPQGSGTAPRADAAPLLITDVEGSSMYMVTNILVPWRRNNTGLLPNGLPKGAGTFNGVVVYDELVRYGDLGRYQIRAMTQDDIALGSTPFSKTIAEWNWSNGTNDVIPEIGTGTFVTHGATSALTSDYNNVTSTDANKGLIGSRAVALTKKWWDFDNDEGLYFDIQFSTAGISGTNLTFGLVWNHGAQNITTLDAPGNWKLLYSVNGTTFNEVPGAGIIQNRSIVWWSGPNTSQDSCPGYRDWMFKLPGDCFGHEEVTVRVQVADKVTDAVPSVTSTTEWWNNLGIGIATLTDKATPIRIGNITVRYN